MEFVIYTNSVDIPPAPSRVGCETDRKVGLSVYGPTKLYRKLPCLVQFNESAQQGRSLRGSPNSLFASSSPAGVMQVRPFKRDEFIDNQRQNFARRRVAQSELAGCGCKLARSQKEVLQIDYQSRITLC
jgi:hypothetical protein